MVNTRSSQFSRKRRRNSSASPSQAGSQASKVRKSNGRHFPTADSQLREEQRMSLERSQESPEGSSTSALHSLECHTPTHSRQNRHSLPANLQVPADVKFEPLIVAIARENQRRRRYTEGLAAGDEDSAADVAGTNTYIELADLGINASQLMTPRSRSIAQPKHTPLSITRRPSPNVKREEDVANYQDVIQKITKENAELLAQVHILRPAIRSLGFGEVDMLEEDICAAIRVNFDELRAQLQEIGAIDLPLEQLCNQELLQCQPDIVRGLLQGIDQYSQAYQEVENRLALIDAEYVYHY